MQKCSVFRGQSKIAFAEICVTLCSCPSYFGGWCSLCVRYLCDNTELFIMTRKGVKNYADLILCGSFLYPPLYPLFPHPLFMSVLMGQSAPVLPGVALHQSWISLLTWYFQLDTDNVFILFSFSQNDVRQTLLVQYSLFISSLFYSGNVRLVCDQQLALYFLPGFSTVLYVLGFFFLTWRQQKYQEREEKKIHGPPNNICRLYPPLEQEIRIRKAKVQMLVNLERDVKNNKMGYQSEERGKGGWCSPLINEKGELDSTVMEKAEVLNEFFTLVFAFSQASHISCVPELLDGSQGRKVPPIVREEEV